MEISFNQTPDIKKLAYRSFHKNHPESKIQNTIGLILGPISTLILFLFVTSLQTESASILEIPNLGLTLICITPPSIIFGWGGYFAYRSFKQRLQTINPDLLPTEYFGETTISIDSLGLHITSPLVSHSHNWSLVSFIECDDFLFFYFGRNMLSFIPMNTFDSKNDADKFTNQIKEFITNSDKFNSINRHSA
jgi:hypothetical protein